MSGIAGILNISDSERAYVMNVGQELVFSAVNQVLAEYNEEVRKMTSVFIGGNTEKFAARHLLPGGGKLQRMGRQAPAAAMKRDGHYDVGYPLRQWGAEMAGDRVDLAYMTISELDAHLDTIMIQDMNTMRWRILTSLFEDSNLAFTDPINGAITVRRLANTDGTLFPPVLGSETEADDDHYSETAYAVAAITDDNNPALTLRNEIAEHFGGVGSTGKNFVYFHAADQTAYMEALTGFQATPDIGIVDRYSDEILAPWPQVPGRLYGRVTGVWLSEWDGWIPDTFGLAVLLGYPPLMKRVDPGYTGLGTGLQLVATDINHPMMRASYEHRYGLGVLNRLSAACIEVSGGGGEYAPPTAYDE